MSKLPQINSMFETRVKGRKRCRALETFILVAVPLAGLLSTTDAAVACNNSQTCEELLAPGSECVLQSSNATTGFCSNPYTKGGCLANRLPGWTKLRVCNSDDPPDAEARGLCRHPYQGLNYTEVRLLSQNWDSAVFVSWMQQILLGELLDVPTTLESGVYDAKINFYDPSNAYDLGVAYEWEALETAKNVLDCRLVDKGNAPDGSTYKACGHVMSEVWANRMRKVEQLEQDAIIEANHFTGVIGKLGWYVPLFAARDDPTLLSHLGLSGEENRRKLAETFLRPMSWSDYCDNISLSNCESADGVANRPPSDAAEGEKFFEYGAYTGYFYKTKDNDCGADNPEGITAKNCTGLFVDYPCGWSSVFQAQAYHNNIALKTEGDQPFGSGYSYPRMVEIWHAANWTRSPVIMHWWHPDALYQEYTGTEAEFVNVALPPATRECIEEYRLDIDQDRCTSDSQKEVGHEKGACDDPDETLMRLISTALYDISYDPALPESRHSPAHQAIRDFRITSLHLDEVFKLWLSRQIDPKGFDPRAATCEWYVISDDCVLNRMLHEEVLNLFLFFDRVVKNIDYFQSFLPRTYPRVTEKQTAANSLQYAALSVSATAVAVVVASFVMTYIKKDKDLVKFAQLEFLYLILTGLLLVSIGALIGSIADSDAECTAYSWLWVFGYNLELIPLIVKIGAVNRLMNAARNLRRVQIPRRTLYGAVFLLSIVVVVFLILWTVLDPVAVVPKYTLTDQLSESGETVIVITHRCQSSSNVFFMTALGGQVALLLCASVLAFQTRTARKEVNESHTLAVLIYAHFLFVLIRLIAVIWLESSKAIRSLAGLMPLLLAVESILSVGIYFLPKFFMKGYDRRTESMTTRNSVLKYMGSTSLRRNEGAEGSDDEEAGTETVQRSEAPDRGSTSSTAGSFGRDLRFIQYRGRRTQCPNCGVRGSVVEYDQIPGEESNTPNNSSLTSGADSEEQDVSSQSTTNA